MTDALLVIAALIVALLGGQALSNATEGVGLLAGACLLAIFARMAQAGRQHAALLRAMEAQRQATNDQLVPDWVCMQCGTLGQDDERDCPRCGLTRAAPPRGAAPLV